MPKPASATAPIEFDGRDPEAVSEARGRVYESIVDAATAHADESGDTDHEVGDLQDALNVAIELMPPDVLAAYVKAMNLN